ncbi:hypothetical protein ACIGG9_29175 [Pseudonocardia alni]|uniref:hypothetical protein n=1 Tax=Pseudonocardia alni TaxID=33907 RepID=UPI0033D8D116
MTDPDLTARLPLRADETVGAVVSPAAASVAKNLTPVASGEATGIECRACVGRDDATHAGGGDQDLVLVQEPAGKIGWMHRDCAREQGYELVPACIGAPDLCGAPTGRPCEPGCPSRAAEVSGTDTA